MYCSLWIVHIYLLGFSIYFFMQKFSRSKFLSTGFIFDCHHVHCNVNNATHLTLQNIIEDIDSDVSPPALSYCVHYSKDLFNRFQQLRQQLTTVNMFSEKIKCNMYILTIHDLPTFFSYLETFVFISLQFNRQIRYWLSQPESFTALGNGCNRYEFVSVRSSNEIFFFPFFSKQHLKLVSYLIKWICRHRHCCWY